MHFTSIIQIIQSCETSTLQRPKQYQPNFCYKEYGYITKGNTIISFTIDLGNVANDDCFEDYSPLGMLRISIIVKKCLPCSIKSIFSVSLNYTNVDKRFQYQQMLWIMVVYFLNFLKGENTCNVTYYSYQKEFVPPEINGVSILALTIIHVRALFNITRHCTVILSSLRRLFVTRNHDGTCWYSHLAFIEPNRRRRFTGI